MKECDMWCLDKLKREYAVLQKKYKLQDFVKLNEDFDIERIAEKETDFVLREIRKAIADKIIAYIRFLEILMNPSNGPIFFFMIAKGLTANDKSTIDSLYKKLAKYEIEVVSLDNKYSEKAEAEFINKIFKEWQLTKDEIEDVMKMLKESWEKQGEKSDKDYFG